MLEELSSKDKVVGLKQVQRAVSAGRAGSVFDHISNRKTIQKASPLFLCEYNITFSLLVHGKMQLSKSAISASFSYGKAMISFS